MTGIMDVGKFLMEIISCLKKKKHVSTKLVPKLD